MKSNNGSFVICLIGSSALLCAASMLSGCAPACSFSMEPELKGLHRIAVLDFTDAPGADAGHSGRVVAGIVGNYVQRVGQWSVVEREHLDKVFEELDLQSISDFDPATAVRVGRLSGADGIIVGEVMQYRIGSIPFLFFVTFDQDLYKIGYSFKLISVETGVHYLSGHVTGQSVVSFDDAISKVTSKLFEEIEMALSTMVSEL